MRAAPVQVSGVGVLSVQRAGGNDRISDVYTVQQRIPGLDGHPDSHGGY
jgi:hypothetical protein